MAFQRKKLASALALALGGGAIVAGAPALAQDIRVEVTGSNIKRVDVEGALPVTVLTREDIARTGAQSAAELLQFITAATSTGNFNGSTVIGATTFRLQIRRCAAWATRARSCSSTASACQQRPTSTAVDLNSLPFGAIERIEVLSDGASAIYGSDAIAGVINFIRARTTRASSVTATAASPTRERRRRRQVDGTVTAGSGAT